MRVLAAALLVAVLVSCSSESPAPVPAPRAPDEAAAVEALKQINQAQGDFIRRTRRYAQRYDELVTEHLLDAEPTRAATGYDFLMLPSPDAVSYTLTATPTDPAARHFFTDQTGAVRVETGHPATSSSPEF